MKNKFNYPKFRMITSIFLFIIALFIDDMSISFKLFIFLSYIFSSFDVYMSASKSIRKKNIFNENTLMIIASLGAFYIGELEEGVLIVILYQIGEYLSDRAINNSKKSIESLVDSRGKYVNVKIDGKFKKTDVKKVKLNTLFEVRPGEVIPLDGIVHSGNGNIDMSSLTGEFIPVSVSKNTKVLSGSINLDGILVIKSTSLYKDSTVTKIVNLIENSNEKKTKTEKYITKFSKVYTPIVIILAVLIVVIPILLGMDSKEWLYRGLEFLVISCPCALVISVPLAFFCGIGRSSHEGILVKGSNELYNLSKIEAIIFDKTGTITEGKYLVRDIHPVEKISKEELVEIASIPCVNSNHPVSKAIIKKYDKEIDKTKIKDFKEISGKGVECKYGRSKLYVGNIEYLNSIGIKVDTKVTSSSTVYVAKSNKYLGYIVVNDNIKESSRTLKENLELLNIKKIVMLSGDSEKAVKKIADEVHIDEWYSNMLPTDKTKKLEEIKSEYFTSFVGDGINDAPVINNSDVGVSMGELGSDIAIEASDVVLMNDNLDNIPKMIKISKLVNNIIKFNIAFAIGFKIIIMILAFIGYTPIWLAVISDVGVTLITIFNDLRILKKNL